MIVVYKGTQAGVDYRGERYKPNIPAYAQSDQTILKNLERLGDFEEYNPELHNTYTRGTVYVDMPTQLPVFLASMTTLGVIKSQYPTCDIDVSCPPHYEFLLPDYCNRVDNVGLQQRTRYYRAWELNPRKPKMRAVFDSPIAKKLENYDKLVLKSTGLFDPLEHKSITPNIIKGVVEEQETDYICLVGSKLSKLPLREKIADILVDQNINVFEIATYRDADIRQYVDKLGGAMFNIIVESTEFDLSYLSCSLGVKTLSFSHHRSPTPSLNEIVLTKFDSFACSPHHEWFPNFTKNPEIFTQRFVEYLKTQIEGPNE